MEIVENAPMVDLTAVESAPLSTPPPIAVEARGLGVYYGAFRAVKDIDLDCVANKITALIGPSGCGKSTVLRTFNRMNDLIPGCPGRRGGPLRRRRHLRAGHRSGGGSEAGGDGFPEAQSVPEEHL